MKDQITTTNKLTRRDFLVTSLAAMASTTVDAVGQENVQAAINAISDAVDAVKTAHKRYREHSLIEANRDAALLEFANLAHRRFAYHKLARNPAAVMRQVLQREYPIIGLEYDTIIEPEFVKAYYDAYIEAVDKWMK